MSALLLDRLLRASIEGGVLVLVVALICKLAPSLHARHRAALWWLAAAKLLVALAPFKPLELPLLPASTPATTTAARVASLTMIAPASSGAPTATPVPPERWIVASWAAGLLVLSAGSLIGAARARRLRRSGRPLDQPALTDHAASAARRLGLRRAPEILLVPGLPGPLVAGLIVPTILLPEGVAGRLSAAELEMAIEHELAHVARRDLWLGLVPAAARRIFFFHPLAWWIEREYAVAREAACDEAVVTRGGADAFTYGRLLLRLATGRPASTAALSPRSMLRRRLEMIERTRDRKPLRARLVWALVAVAAAGFVPMRLVARDTPAPEAPPTPAAAEAAPAPAGTPAPIARTAATLPPAPAPAPPAMSIPSPVARAATPIPVAPAPAPPAPRATTVSKRSAVPPPAPPEAPEAQEAPAPPPPPAVVLERCLELGHAKDTAFVITNGDAHTMCGDIADIRDAERARGDGDDIIWFRVDGQDYVIRDRGTVAEAHELFRAEHLIGDEQSKVGDVQAAIGDKQAAIGSHQEQIAEAQERIAKELDAADRNLDLQDKMTALSRRMEELGRQMQLLSEQQAALGARQQALGEKMTDAAAAAQKRLAELLEKALENGRAEKAN